MATPPVPKPNPKDFNQERYDRLTKNLLEIIASNEGTYNSNLIPEKAKEIIKTPYDMVYGYGKYLFPNKPPTEMTIREVIDFGRPLVNKTIKSGLGSSAMGKYQVMANSYKRNKPNNKGVLEEFANKLNLNIDTQLFTPEIQDAIAIRMLEERVPSLKDFATSETDENLNKVLDELNATWRGVPDSKNETSEGQNLTGLSVEEIGDELKRIKYVEGGTFDPMGSKKTDYSETDRMLQDNKMDEQEINAGDQSLANQRDIQRKTTKEQSGFNFISSADAADLGTIDRTVREELNKADPIDADSTRDRMGVTTPPTNAASDAFQADQMMEDYNTVNEDENLFRGSMNEDTEVEPLGDMSYPEGYTEYDSLNNATDEQEFDESDDTVVEREGMDFSEPEGVADISFFESLFNDVGMGDFTTEQDYTFEADTLNLNEGGHVEKEVDFVKDKESVEDSDNGDPPPGATPEEVADDVPAMLSEGEYVLPANVVRYLGLERVISMHRRVLSEIQQMEDLGMIQNVDEDGKPEDDDNEMKFSDKKPKSGSIEIVVASSKPKGIMSFDKGGFFDVGGDADPSADTFESNREMHVGSDPSVGSRDPGEIFQSAPEYSDFGADGNIPIFNLGVNELKESFGDDGDYNEERRFPELTAQQRTDMAIDVAMDSIDPEKITAETTNQFRQAMDNIQKDNPNTGMAVEKILDMVGVGRVVKAMEAFEGYMRDRRMEARNAAGAKAEARAAKDGITDQVKINQMKMEAMNSAWAAPGFSRAEDLAWAGGASEMIPDDYGNDYEDGRDGMTPTRNNPTGVALKLINDLKSGPLSAQNELGMAPSIMNIDVKPQPKDKKKKLASGGLMQKKKFNQGGAYIEGVGYRELTEPLTVEGAFDNEVKTYEDVIAEMQGFTGKDRFPEERVLKGKELKKRRQQARRLPRIDSTTIDPKISRRDPFIALQLKNAGVDTENYGSVVDAYRQGSTRILGSGSAAANRQLIKTLDNYAESKRMQYDGFTQKDLDNLPEGSTNKDALKKIFSTELQFRQGDFGYPGDDQDFANVGENVGTGMNNPLATGAPFRPMQGATIKHDYLHASGPLKPEAERLLKFEDEANLDQINRLTSFLNTQGDKKYVDPTHRKYVDNIFRNFEDFRGTGLWELDSEKDPPKTMSSAIMGNQFVEGVGYR